MPGKQDSKDKGMKGRNIDESGVGSASRPGTENLQGGKSNNQSQQQGKQQQGSRQQDSQQQGSRQQGSWQQGNQHRGNQQKGLNQDDFGSDDELER